jgi:hypothetical protein
LKAAPISVSRSGNEKGTFNIPVEMLKIPLFSSKEEHNTPDLRPQGPLGSPGSWRAGAPWFV